MATSPILGIETPTLADSDDVPVYLAALAEAVEPFTTTRYASSGERSAAIPAPVRGMISFLQSDGWPTYYDGSMWRPFSGQRLALYHDVPTVSIDGMPAGLTIGIMGARSLASYPFPTIARVSFKCYVSQDGGARSDIKLAQNGTIVRNCPQFGPGSNGAPETFDIAAGATGQGFQPILTNVNSAGGATVSIDGSVTWMTIEHLAA